VDVEAHLAQLGQLVVGRADLVQREDPQADGGLAIALQPLQP
jgi:hypothetical protein